MSVDQSGTRSWKKFAWGRWVLILTGLAVLSGCCFLPSLHEGHDADSEHEHYQSGGHNH